MRTSLLRFAFLLTALLPALPGLGHVAGLQAYPAIVCGNTYNATFADNPVVPAYQGQLYGLLADTFTLTVTTPQYYIVRQTTQQGNDVRILNASQVDVAGGPYAMGFLPAGAYSVVFYGKWRSQNNEVIRSGAYSFTVECNTAPFNLNQPLLNPTHIALGQRVQGTLAGQPDRVRYYTNDGANPGALGQGTATVQADGYWPGADQAFSFSVPAAGLVRVLGPNGSNALGGYAKILNGPNTGTVMGGTPSGAWSYTEAATLLEAGTRYLTIEQGSETVGQPYDFTVLNTCVPSGGANIAQGLFRIQPSCCGTSTPQANLSAPGYYFFETAFACTLGQGFSLGLNSYNPLPPAGFVRVYLDLNQDGDYQDANELIVGPQAFSTISGVTGFSIQLNPSNLAYQAVAGSRVPMRVQVSTTAFAGGPCEALPNGTTLDVYLQVAGAAVPFVNLACGQPVSGATDGLQDSEGLAYDTLTFFHTEAAVSTPSGPVIDDHYTELRFLSLNGHQMQILDAAFQPLSGWAQSHDFSVIQNTYGRYYVRVKSPVNLFGAALPSYSLVRSCHVRYPPNRYQYINGPATPLIANNQRVQGNLTGQADNLWRYDRVGDLPAGHMPGADRQYRFITSAPTRTTVRNLAPGSGPYALHRHVLLNDAFSGGVVGLSAATNSPATNGGVFDASALLPAGTYYVSVEQGSATTNEAFDFAVKQFCTPVASAPVMPGVLFVNGFAAGPVNLTNATGYRYTSEPIALTVGQAATFSLVNNIGGSSSLFNRALIDFNDDGLFDSATETVALSNAIAPNWAVQVLISPFNTAARAAWGRQVAMRIQGSSSSLATAAGCANLATGYTADYEVRIAAPNPQPPAGSFGFAQLREVKGAAGADRYTRVRLAPDGSTYACGSFTGTATFSGGTAAAQSFTAAGGTDGMLVRYTPQGNLAWVCRFSSTGTDEALGLGVDRLGNAYVCGFFTGSMTVTPSNGPAITLVSAGGEDGFVARVLPDGRIQWIFRTGAEGNDRNNAIDVTPNFRFYLAGSFVGRSAMGGAFGTVVNLTSRGNADAFLARFTEVGSMFWVVQVGGPGNDFGFGAATDASGNGYLLGSYEGTATYTASNFSTTVFSLTSAGGSDGFVASVDGNGVRRWVQEIKGPTNEVVRDVAMDPNGGALVAVGAFSNTATFGPFTLSSRGFNDGFAFRLSTGTVPQVQWARRIGGFGQDRALGVRIDRQGNPIVTGNFAQTPNEVFGAVGTPLTSVGGLDGYLAKLERNSGLLLYLTRFGGAGDEEPLSADTAAGGGATIAGSYQQTVSFAPMPAITSAGLADGFIASYLYTPTSTPPPIRLGDEDGALAGTPAATALRVYPNPTLGRFSLSFDGAGRLQAYAADGRLVLDQPVAAGQPVEAGLTPGIYQLRLQTEGKADRTTRLVVQ